jgi:hypothetical protein
LGGTVGENPTVCRQIFGSKDVGQLLGAVKVVLAIVQIDAVPADGKRDVTSMRVQPWRGQMPITRC